MHDLREADFRYHCVAKREKQRGKKKPQQRQQGPPPPLPPTHTKKREQASYFAGLAQSVGPLNRERKVAGTITGARTTLRVFEVGIFAYSEKPFEQTLKLKKSIQHHSLLNLFFPNIQLTNLLTTKLNNWFSSF